MLGTPRRKEARELPAVHNGDGGKQVPGLLLYGAHENGTGLAPDEIRSIRRLCADAGHAYGRRTIVESERAAFLDHQVEPLSV